MEKSTPNSKRRVLDLTGSIYQTQPQVPTSQVQHARTPATQPTLNHVPEQAPFRLDISPQQVLADVQRSQDADTVVENICYILQSQGEIPLADIARQYQRLTGLPLRMSDLDMVRVDDLFSLPALSRKAHLFRPSGRQPIARWGAQGNRDLSEREHFAQARALMIACPGMTRKEFERAYLSEYNVHLPREVVDSNEMKAAIWRSPRYRGELKFIPSFDRQMINTFVTSTRDALINQKKHVSTSIVTMHLLQHFGVKSFSDLLVGSPSNVPELKQIFNTEQKVTSLVETFCHMRVICTAHELCEFVLRGFKDSSKASEVKDITRYDDLRMGPFIAHPILHESRFFAIDATVKEVHNISTGDVIRAISELRRGENKKNPSPGEIIAKVAREFRIAKPQNCGVYVDEARIQSHYFIKFGRIILREKAIRDKAYEAAEKAKQAAEKEARSAEDARKKAANIQYEGIDKKLLETLEEVAGEFQDKFGRRIQRAEDVVWLLFDAQSRCAEKTKLSVTSLFGPNGVVSFVQHKPTLCKFFKQFGLAIASEDESPEESYFRESEIEEAIRNCVEGTDLASLAECERQVVSTLHMDSFEKSVGVPFLSFIENHPELLADLSTPPLAEFSAVERFVSDTMYKTQDIKEDELTEALKAHFDVTTVSTLGHGSVASLQARIRPEANTPLLHAMASAPTFLRGSARDVLRHDSSSKATTCAIVALSSVPWLLDIGEYLQWRVSFESSLGPLSEFVATLPPASDWKVLAVGCDRFVRIPVGALDGSQAYSDALTKRDSRLAMAHLITLAATSTHNTLPTALLVVHTVTAFMEIAVSGVPTLAGFVVECLELLNPELLRAFLFSCILLPALEEVVVSRSRAVTVLLDACVNEQELSLVYALGIRISDSDLKENFTKERLTGVQKHQFAAPARVVEMVGAGTKPVLSMIHHAHVEPTPTQISSNESDPVRASTEDSSPHMKALVPFETRRDHIMMLRKKRFGIGRERNEEDEQIHQEQCKREERMMKELSMGLYSSDTHFVLELVQNADDNKYLETSEHVPTLRFVLKPNEIMVMNNETGFTAGNIDAICDVSNSSKKTVGYIGQKGIGFKSVFRVTNRPEVHSNGYHICFDREDSPLGFILPTWIECPETDVVTSLTQHWNTVIRLPLLTQYTNNSLCFEDLRSELLLFLRQLRCIQLEKVSEDEEGKQETRIRTFLRKDLENGLVEIIENGDKQYKQQWLLASLPLQPPIQRKDITVEETEVAMAFPLYEDLAQRDLLPTQRVFAFLPLQSYGFRFVLQADFILPSSRETIDESSPWNQFLISKIPNTFVKAVHHFKFHFKDNPKLAFQALLRFLPKRSDIHKPFESLPDEISRRLAGEECVLTEAGLWKKPSQCVVVPADLPRTSAVLKEDVLREVLGLHVVRQDVVSEYQELLCKTLRVRKLGITELTAVLKSRLEALKDNELSAWLLAVDEAYESEPLNKVRTEALQQIKQMKVLRIVGQASRMCASQSDIFLPIATTKAHLQPKQKAFYDCAKMAAPDLCQLVDDAFLAGLDADSKAGVIRFFKLRLKLTELCAKSLVFGRALPAFSDSRFQKSERLHATLVELLNRYWDSLDASEKQLKQKLITEARERVVLFTVDRQLERVSSHRLVLGAAYGGDQHIQKLVVPGVVEFCVVSPVYRNKYRGLEWKKFFLALGVHESLPLQFTERRVPRLPSGHSESGAGYVIKDCESVELDAILNWIVDGDATLKERLAKAKTLAQYLCGGSRALSESGCFEAQVRVLQSGDETFQQAVQSRQSPSIDSAILTALKRAWIPTSRGVLKKPTECFIGSQCEELLGQAIHMCPPELSNLSQQLGVKSSVEVSDVIDVLRKICDTPPPDLDIKFFVELYKFCFHPDHSKDQLEAFVDEPLIMFPLKSGQLRGYPLSKIRLIDETKVMDGYAEDQDPSSTLPRIFAAKFHPTLVQAVRKADVCDLFCTFDDYLALLDVIVSQGPPDAGAFNDVVSVFQGWSAGLVKHSTTGSGGIGPEEFAGWLEKLRPRAVFPSQSDRWVSLEQQLFVNDDPKVADLFAEEDSVHFIKVPPHKAERNQMVSWLNATILPFLTACGVRNISEVAKPQVTAIGSAFGQKIGNLIHTFIPLIQRYLYTTCEKFGWTLKERHDEFYGTLASLTCAVVDEVHIKYHIGGIFSRETKGMASLDHSTSNLILYISRERAGPHSELDECFDALTSLFLPPLPERSHLIRFLRMVAAEVRATPNLEPENTNEVMRENLSPLPEDLPVWRTNLLQDEYQVSDHTPEMDKTNVEEIHDGPTTPRYSTPRRKGPSLVEQYQAENRAAGLEVVTPSASTPILVSPKAVSAHERSVTQLAEIDGEAETDSEDEEGGESVKETPSSAQEWKEILVPLDAEFPPGSRSEHSASSWIGLGGAGMTGFTFDHVAPGPSAPVVSEMPPAAPGAGGQTGSNFNVVVDSAREGHRLGRRGDGDMHQAHPIVHLANGAEDSLPSTGDVVFRDLSHDFATLVAHYPAQHETEASWAECLIFRYLQNEFPAPAFVVEWMNQLGPTTAPYDVVVKTAGGDYRMFAEVKSTTSPHKGWFEISWNELECASKHGSKYNVFQVCGVRQSKVTVHRLTDPIEKCRLKKLNLLLHLQ